MSGIDFLTEMKGAVFDLDGVLVNTAKYHYLAWKRLAKQLGFEFSEKDNERLKGVSRMRSLEILLEVGGLTFPDDEKERLAAIKNSWYVEYIEKIDESELLPGAVEYLQELKNTGVKVALGSGSKNARVILKNTRIVDVFDAVIDGNRVTKAKPDPQVFLLAAEELGLPPRDCVVFEDAEAGIEAAKSAGMRCVAIGSRDTLSGADAYSTGLNGILNNQFE